MRQPGSLFAGSRSAALALAQLLHPEHVALSVAAQVNEGVVIAVGPGRRSKDGELLPVGVKEGDKVLLPEYGGNLIKLQDKE